MTVRTEGYTFIAMRSPTGKMHLVWSEHFKDRDYPPPAGRTLCGRRTTDRWEEVPAKWWYTRVRKCLYCAPAAGPYATVKLGGFIEWRQRREGSGRDSEGRVSQANGLT